MSSKFALGHDIHRGALSRSRVIFYTYRNGEPKIVAWILLHGTTALILDARDDQSLLVSVQSDEGP
jgi:hypothetical protein